VQFVSAGDRAVAGTYDVNVTQLATQATSTGLTGSWPPATLPTINVRVNGNNVSYVVKSSDTRDDVVKGLNAAFGNAGLPLQATNTGSGVQINTDVYGSGATFDVDWGDGNGYTTLNGLDVAGTINGVAATGRGQQLMVPFADNTLSGLALKITATTTGDLGNFTYNPGLAQRVQTAVTAATDPTSGYITSTENDYKSRIDFVNDQIADMEQQVTAYETMLRAEWTNLETTISTLKSQGTFLTSQLNSMFQTGGSSSSGSSGSGSSSGG